MRRLEALVSGKFALKKISPALFLNPTTGTYLAGDRVGVIDAIILTDANCEGSARLEIQIVEPMEAHPSQPELEPGDVIEFSASYGSGDFELLMSPQSKRWRTPGRTSLPGWET